MDSIRGITNAGGAALSPGFAEGWRRRGIERLLPFQRRVVRETGLTRGESVMLVAPTSAGKTLPAELAIACQIDAGRRAAYLVPTRALAEEKFATLRAWLAPMGLRVVCATRERPEADRAVFGGEFDVLVAVYEKMNHYLLAAPDVLAGMGVVVIDEIQMLGEARRGGLLDLLITKIRLSPYRTQLIALAPQMAEAEAVARWLGAELLLDRRRPRELREGVLDASTGIFQYRNLATEEDGIEALADPATLEALASDIAEGWLEPEEARESPEAVLLAAAARLAEPEEPLIVFAPTRPATRLWAERLARIGSDAAPARLALPKLEHAEACGAARLMRFCLERGVAFHNADLSAPMRRLVEEAFDAGELRAIVSTPTLGLGVNLAARNVLQYPWRVETGAGGGVVRAPLGRDRFANQGGRAAWLGLGEGGGRSIVVARTKDEANRLWHAFVCAPPEPMAEPLRATPHTSILLDLLGGGTRRSAENLAEAVRSTFTVSSAVFPGVCSRTRGEEGESDKNRAGPNGLLAGRSVAARIERGVPRSLEACAEAELIRRDDLTDLWSLTGLGEIAARLGLRAATITRMRQSLERFIPHHASQLVPASDLMLMLAMTEDGQDGLALVPPPTRLLARAIGEMLRRTDEPEDDPVLGGLTREMIGRNGAPSRIELRAWQASAILSDWLAGHPTETIERKFNILHGSLHRLGEHFAWLAGALAALAAAVGRPEAQVRALGLVARRLPLGLPESALGLAELRVGFVSRSALIWLAAEGIDGAGAVLGCDEARLVDWVGQDAARALLDAARASVKSPPRKVSEFVPGRTGDSGEPPREIEATQNVRMPENPQALENPHAPQATAAGSPIESQTERQPNREPNTSKTAGILLEISLTSPGLVHAGGREVFLPPLSFELLSALAERRGEVVTRAALYHRLWPEGGPEEQQLDGHRRTLINRLRPSLGAAAEHAAEVVRGIGFRLAIPPELILFRRA